MDDTPVAVTCCPLCNSGVVYERAVGGTAVAVVSDTVAEAGVFEVTATAFGVRYPNTEGTAAGSAGLVDVDVAA